MSKSYRKTPIFGIAKPDELKWYKRLHNKRNRTKLRDILKIAIKNTDFDDLTVLEQELLKWNEWDCPRDGKSYISDRDWETIAKYIEREGKKASWKKFMSK